jgi:hypothetical protein
MWVRVFPAHFHVTEVLGITLDYLKCLFRIIGFLFGYLGVWFSGSSLILAAGYIL